jgi:cation diffusion facilitator CzcD-associated flavoprotein CzcO
LSAPACQGSARPVISVVTDEIETFTETGLRLASDEELEADIIVTATGLKKWLTGGISINVAGTPFDVGNATAYKGVIFSDVPNLVAVFGYTDASWTSNSISLPTIMSADCQPTWIATATRSAGRARAKPL